MINAILFINVIVFFAISGIHIYWAFGGKWASQAVIPTSATQKSEKAIFKPTAIATLIVASGLAAFGFILLNVFLKNIHIVNYQEVLLNAIAGIFFIRAIGDFKYVGFFKKIRDTRFAINDTKLFSPLCLWLGISTIFVNYW